MDHFWRLCGSGGVVGGPPQNPTGKEAPGEKHRTPPGGGVCEGLWMAGTCAPLCPLCPLTSGKSPVPPGTPHGLEPAEQLRLCWRKLFLGQDALVSELG